MPSRLVLCALLAFVSVTDLACRRIPNRALALAAVAALALAGLGEPPSIIDRIGASAAGAIALLPLAAARPGALGMGDVKLVAAMGMFLGAALVVAVTVAFSAGALAGTALLLRHGPAARGRALPLAPFLALGGVVALVAGDAVLHWYGTRMSAP